MSFFNNARPQAIASGSKPRSRLKEPPGNGRTITAKLVFHKIGVRTQERDRRRHHHFNSSVRVWSISRPGFSIRVVVPDSRAHEPARQHLRVDSGIFPTARHVMRSCAKLEDRSSPLVFRLSVQTASPDRGRSGYFTARAQSGQPSAISETTCSSSKICSQTRRAGLKQPLSAADSAHQTRGTTNEPVTSKANTYIPHRPRHQ